MNALSSHGSAGDYRFSIFSLPTAGSCLLLAVISFAIYSPTLTGYFVGDDFAYVQLYLRERLSEWPKLFAADWSQGIWGVQLPELRPIIALSFMWDASVWTANPIGYHVTNVSFHALNSILVFLVMRLLIRGSLAASLVAGSLFAVHPAHVEAVSWITGRVELISTFFYLLGILAFGLYRCVQRRAIFYSILSFIMFMLGLFSKETVISFPLMIIAYDLLHQSGRPAKNQIIRWWWIHTIFVVALAGYLYIRELIFSSPVGPVDIARFSSFVARQALYLYYLLVPTRIQGGEVRASWLLVPWAGLLLVLAFLLILRLVAGSQLGALRRPVLFFGAAWYLISTLPLIPTYVAARHLYLPSAGVCIVLGLLLQNLVPNRLFAVAALVPLTFYGSVLLQLNWNWREASQLSETIRAEVESLSREIPARGGLILNVPFRYRGAYVWAWASPFVLQKPFIASEPYLHFRVLENSDSYCCKSWREDKFPVVLSLIEHPADSYFVNVDQFGHVAKKRIGREQIRELLSAFLPELEQSDRAQLPARWHAFWAAQLGS